MAKHRQAARIDNNQNDIIDILKTVPGVSVVPGHDDILVGFRRRTYWFEIKNEETAISKRNGKPRKNALQDSQEKLLMHYTGHYEVVWNADQILRAIGAIK